MPPPRAPSMPLLSLAQPISGHGSTEWTFMPQAYSSSDDTHAMVARLAPVILGLLGDGLPRSRHDIVTALTGQHARDEDVRTLMRLVVTGKLVEIERKYCLAPPPESDQG